MRALDKDTQLSNDQTRAAEQGAKGLIPVGRPFLDYALNNLADAGIRDVCLVIGPEHHAMRDYYGRELAQELTRLRISFAEQRDPLGTANALVAARTFAGAEDVLVLNADNLYPTEAIRLVANARTSALIGFASDALVRDSNIPAERIRSFALVESDTHGTLTAIHEKPDQDLYNRLKDSALVSMNLWRFRPVIFDACVRVHPSNRGELELQDAVRLAAAEGEQFTVIAYSGGVLDLSRREDIPKVTAMLAGRTVSL